MIGRSSFHARDSLSLYSVKSLTLQMEKREPARRSVAGPQMRSRTRHGQAEAGPSRRAPPIHASAQPGPSTENMSFEEAYVHYNYDLYQAGSSGFAGGQGPYYPTGMHSPYGPQVGPSSSAHLVNSSSRCRTRWHTTPSSLRRIGG